MSKHMRYLIIGGALFVLAGCNIDTSLGISSNGCFVMCGNGALVAYSVSPSDAYVLRGDTAMFYAWSCDGSFCVLSGDDVPSNWSISGDAGVLVLSGGATSRRVSGAATITFRGTEIGTSSLTAVATRDSTLRATVRAHVADSSAITRIERTDLARDTLRANDFGVLWIALKDGAGNKYTARPTAWSVSDASVLELSGSATAFFGATQQRFQAKSVGSADIIVTFRDLTTTVHLTVVP